MAVAPNMAIDVEIWKFLSILEFSSGMVKLTKYICVQFFPVIQKLPVIWSNAIPFNTSSVPFP